MSFKVWIHALGCRSNLCDGDFLAGDFARQGAEVYSSVGDLNKADAAVFITCSVTAEADRKCRQIVRRARKTLGPRGVIAVCGCWAQALASGTARELGIDILVGTRGRVQLAETVLRMLDRLDRLDKQSGAHDSCDFLDLRCAENPNDKTWEELPLQGTGFHTRAFVKVQEGCAHFCSYCIIPFLRGRPVSRPVSSVLDEITRLVDAGCREVVLTGTHLGAWGRDLGPDFSLARLIRAVSEIPGLTRLRLGSLEPFALVDAKSGARASTKNTDLLTALSESPVFMPHLHLPLQSGDDKILSQMRRGYTARDFIQVCDRARAILGDDLHISSDILVGFPGESDAAFENTLNLMREVGMGRVHVFPFSARAGTAAAGFPDMIAPDIKAKRTERAIALGATLLNEYASRFMGRTVEVLCEPGEHAHGYTQHYLEAVWPSASGNELVSLKVDRVSNTGGSVRLECQRETSFT